MKFMIGDFMKSRDPAAEPYEVTQFVAEVGLRVRVMRLARGLTQAELAERAEMSRQTVMAIEAGALVAAGGPGPMSLGAR